MLLSGFSTLRNVTLDLAFTLVFDCGYDLCLFVAVREYFRINGLLRRGGTVLRRFIAIFELLYFTQFYSLGFVLYVTRLLILTFALTFVYDCMIYTCFVAVGG